MCIIALMHVCIDAISFQYAFVFYNNHGILILLSIIAVLIDNLQENLSWQKGLLSLSVP